MIVSLLFVDSPQVSLRLGRTLDADNIRTGHDVYFECDVKANPSPLRLEWLHNVNTWWRCTISKEAWLVEHRPDRLKIAFFPFWFRNAFPAVLCTSKRKYLYVFSSTNVLLPIESNLEREDMMCKNDDIPLCSTDLSAPRLLEKFQPAFVHWDFSSRALFFHTQF